MLRRMICLLGIGVITFGAYGCDGGGVGEGVPDKVDMTKSHAPTIDMPGMSPKIAKDAQKAKSAPAAAPEK